MGKTTAEQSGRLEKHGETQGIEGVTIGRYSAVGFANCAVAGAFSGCILRQERDTNKSCASHARGGLWASGMLLTHMYLTTTTQARYYTDTCYRLTKKMLCIMGIYGGK